MGNLTSQDPTMFWILKSLNLAGNPNFCIILAYLRAARRLSSSLFAPVHTILPELEWSKLFSSFTNFARLLSFENYFALWFMFNIFIHKWEKLNLQFSLVLMIHNAFQALNFDISKIKRVLHMRIFTNIEVLIEQKWSFCHFSPLLYS